MNNPKNPFTVLILNLKSKLKQIPFPFYSNISFYEYFQETLKIFSSSSLNLYASAISLHFFMSIVPFFLFLLTLVAYLPFLKSYESLLLTYLHTHLPPELNSSLIEPIHQLYQEKRFDLLSLSTIIMLYHSSNAFHALIQAFHAIYKITQPKLPFWKRWLNTFLLLFIFLSIFLISFFVALLIPIFYDKWLYWLPSSLFTVFQYLFLFLFFLFIFFTLFRFGLPGKKTALKFLLFGALVSAILFLIGSSLFAYYFHNFSTYNKFYGSFGAILVTILWFYLFGYATLIGFASFAIFLRESKGKRNRSLKKQIIQS